MEWSVEDVAWRVESGSRRASICLLRTDINSPLNPTRVNLTTLDLLQHVKSLQVLTSSIVPIVNNQLLGLCS